MLLGNSAKTMLLLSIILAILSTECLAAPQNVRKRFRYGYDIVEELGHYKPQPEDLYEVSEYNEIGDLLQWVLYDRRRGLVWKKNYQYNKQRYMIEEAVYGSGGYLSAKFIFKRDDNGNEIERSRYDSEGKLVEKRLWRYDEDGDYIEEHYDSEGKLSLRNIHVYDETGNEIELSGYGPDGELEGKLLYIYDERGNRLMEAGFGKRSLRSLYLFKYDESGKTEEAHYDSLGRLYWRAVYKFNEEGNVLELLRYKSQGLDSRRVYQYNENGDCSEEIEYVYEFAFGEMQEIPTFKYVYEYEYY